MRAPIITALFAVALFAVGCSEHGEGGPLDGPSGPIVDANCTPGAACAPGSQCFIEGHAACNVPPVSGGCSCNNGVFECFTSCPVGCPEQVPNTGDSCVIEEGGICPYEAQFGGPPRVECRCTSGVFACSSNGA